MSRSRMKHISEFEADCNTIGVRKPFQLIHEQKRRYIRLQISEPIEYWLLKDRAGEIFDEYRAPVYHGTILNLSAGGVLVLSDSAIEEGSLVLVKMTLQEIEVIDRVMGLVKRTEADGEKWLIGLEFLSRESLIDYLSEAEIDMLPTDAASFDDRVRNIMNKYVYTNRIRREFAS